MNICRSALLVGVGLLSASASMAHHSFAMVDRTQETTLQGTVKDFQWTNPHVFLQVLVHGDKGDEEWSIEGASPNMLFRDGWSKTSFQVGDQLTLVVNPLRDHGHGGYFLHCRFADGRTLVPSGRGRKRLARPQKIGLALEMYSINRILLGAMCLGAATLSAEHSVNAKEPSAPNLDGIWSGTQGVLWETNMKPGEPENPPFTPEFAARYQAARAAAAAGKPKADPPAACLPPGVPRIMASPFPFEIIQQPKTIYILFEYMSQIQRIFLDGSGHGSLGLPTFNGYSEGHWEKNELVVNTIDLNPISVLDTTHVETSDALKVEERFRLAGSDKLEVTITLDDSKAFTHPWVTHRIYVRKPGEQILPYVCEENNRNPVKADGTTDFIGPK